VPCEGGTPPLGRSEVERLLGDVSGWRLSDDGKRISRAFDFKNFWQTMAFVNAAAWVAHQQDHHPDLQVSYRRCVVEYWTHAAGGLTENDFICAAKLDALIARR
jgi:4a-hydroxytetrahydrobiopterin dehydratase